MASCQNGSSLWLWEPIWEVAWPCSACSQGIEGRQLQWPPPTRGTGSVARRVPQPSGPRRVGNTQLTAGLGGSLEFPSGHGFLGGYPPCVLGSLLCSQAVISRVSSKSASAQISKGDHWDSWDHRHSFSFTRQFWNSQAGGWAQTKTLGQQFWGIFFLLHDSLAALKMWECNVTLLILF